MGESSTLAGSATLKPSSSVEACLCPSLTHTSQRERWAWHVVAGARERWAWHGSEQGQREVDVACSGWGQREVGRASPFKWCHPVSQDEQERIEAAGGLVIWMGSWRVNGNLSVSRAIGDAAEKSLIVGEADVMSEVLGGSEDYLLLACDGVWDVLNGDEVAESVYKHLSRGGTKQGVAKAIVDFARSEGSGDNITAIVLFFPTFQLVAPPTLETPPTVAAPPTAAVEAESQDKSMVSEQPL